MAHDVGRVQIRLVYFIVIILGLFVYSCGEDDAPPASPAIDGTMWNVTINNAPSTVTLHTQSTIPRSDGGLDYEAVGQDEISVDVELELKIGGSVGVVSPPDQVINVSTPDITVLLKLGGVNYVATSGSITITFYNASLGGTLAGSLDLGFVAPVSGFPASLQGDFSAVVTSSLARLQAYE